LTDGAVPRVGRRFARLGLAARIALLYAVGTSVLLLLLGSGLGWMLRGQLEARDREEIDGKTEVVVHLLHELGTAERIVADAYRIADVGIGHPHLQLGLREGPQWLVRLAPELEALAVGEGGLAIPHAPQLGRYRIGADLWWLRRVEHASADRRQFTAFVGVHVNTAQQILERFVAGLLVAGALGVLASAALGGFVARRGLAPLRHVAGEAERVSAQRLGQPLNVADAPVEVRGLLQSINRMLERLQASFRALEDFSADIAHELRTPLNNLMLQTQVTLSRARPAEEYQDALHSNLQELERLQRMVADMLFLARADRDMVPLRSEQLDLVAEARHLAEYFELAASEHGQRIEVAGQSQVACDPALIRRALTNLLSNAVRYAPAGAVIRVEGHQRQDGAAVVDVTNPAPPMAPEELHRLFARFVRGSTPASGDAARAAEGVGLGLSIVESIMRLHGGHVQAESTADGLRLRLVFAAAPSSARAPAAGRDPAPTSRMDSSGRSRDSG